ncbi:MAG: PHP domain-containing protein [Acidobacteria bacterium]|nr:PHP domain-containing protein [Acidobacteriota bacterium]
MRFELHCHTESSHDGFTSLDGLIAECREKGIDAVAVTEHDVFCLTEKDLEKARGQGVFLIPSMEVTTDKGVHVIGFFINRRIEQGPIEGILASIRDQGGLISIPHPFKPGSGLLGNPLSSAEEITAALQEADFIEAWNGGFDLSPFQEEIRDLAQVHGLRCIAASDAHRQWEVGMLVTEMDLDSPVNPAALRLAMSKAPTSLLKARGYISKVKRQTFFQRFRHTDWYQALIAKVPYSLKRSIRIWKYGRKLARYYSVPVQYEAIP